MAFSEKVRNIVYAKFDGHCAYCGDPIERKQTKGKKSLQVDHIISQYHFKNFFAKIHIPVFLYHLSKDDINHIDNLFPSCNVCNFYKTGDNLEAFRDRLNNMVNVLKRDSTTYNRLLQYGLIKETNKPVVFHFERFKTKTK